jgi:hypothetical protein
VDAGEDLGRRLIALGFELAQPLLVLRPLGDEERDVVERGRAFVAVVAGSARAAGRRTSPVSGEIER